MNNKTLINNLDFSSGSDSWFDFWHTHADWGGDGNKDWEIRKKAIDELVDIYNNLKVKIKNYPKEFQLFIMILENDSSQDSIFIHSNNPNQDNFPLKIEKTINFPIKDKNLKEYIDNLGLNVTPFIFNNELQYYLFDDNVGIPL